MAQPSAPEAAGLGPGIYLHVPFCRRRCGYCDFASTTGDAAARDAFVEDLISEVGLAAGGGEFASAAFQTIFLGGGTPSLLEGDQVQRIVESLRSSFILAPGAEVTIEANPESLTPRRLDAVLRAGVNRVSLGVQSLDNEALRMLDRAHDAAMAKRRAAELTQRRVSFSVDLIYGLPGLDGRSWGGTLDAALAFESDHLSAYLLTLEPGTPMHAALARGEIALPGEEEVREQYETLQERAAAAGLPCYEISNFARPGRESRHNQNYWLRGEYLGLGPSAHSHRAGWRWANERDLAAWSRALRAGESPVASREQVRSRQAAEEWIYLGLRRTAGLPWTLLAEAAGDGAGALQRRAAFLAQEGLLAWREGRLCLAPAGRFVSDAIFADLMAAMDTTDPAGEKRG